jgi:hypothetical protein
MTERDDAVVELASTVAGLLFEIRIAATAVDFGVQTLITRPDAAPMREELVVLKKLTNQCCEALDILQRVFVEHIPREP